MDKIPICFKNTIIHWNQIRHFGKSNIKHTWVYVLKHVFDRTKYFLVNLVWLLSINFYLSITLHRLPMAHFPHFHPKCYLVESRNTVRAFRDSLAERFGWDGTPLTLTLSELQFFFGIHVAAFNRSFFWYNIFFGRVEMINVMSKKCPLSKNTEIPETFQTARRDLKFLLGFWVRVWIRWSKENKYLFFLLDDVFGRWI